MKKERSGASLFLLELLIGLLISAWCAAVCTRLFAISLETAQGTASYTDAVQIAQNVAEQCRSGVAPQKIAGRWSTACMPDAQGEYIVKLSAKEASNDLADVAVTVKSSEGIVLYTLYFSCKETEI